MIINQYRQHDLYNQTGNFSFAGFIKPQSNSGVSSFGLSGTQNQNKIEFKLISGRIYDWNSNFVSTYSIDNNEPVRISGVVGNASVDYYINEEPVAFGIPRRTGYFNKIYSNSNEEIGLDFFINGNPPDYNLDTLVVFGTGDSYVPISFQNNSPFPFTIFSGNYLGKADLFSFSGQPTGIVTTSKTFNLFPSGQITAGLNVLPFNFYTDFGLLTPNIGFSGQVDFFSGLYLELIGPSTVLSDGTGQYTVHFSNSGEQISVFPYLKYLAGSGLQTANTILTGYYNVIAAGLITGSGNLSGLVNVTGSGYGGVSQLLVSGIINSGIIVTQWATGIQLTSTSILSTGVATGVNYNGLATGIINILLSGDIMDGSGDYYATGRFTGTPSFSYSINPTGSIQATGAIYYNIPSVNDILYIDDNQKAIVNGFHYDSIDNLTSFINANTGDYHVTGSKVGGVIYLTSLKTGTLGNSTILQTDSANVGNLAISNSTLRGGVSLGVGNQVLPVTPFTGYFYNFIEGTGIYSQNLTGVIFGSKTIDDFYKDFTGVWNLQTGFSLNSMFDYRDNGWISDSDTYIYESGKIISQVGNFYINVPYTALGSGQDVAVLFVSGFNTNHSVNTVISGIRS